MQALSTEHIAMEIELVRNDAKTSMKIPATIHHQGKLGDFVNCLKHVTTGTRLFGDAAIFAIAPHTGKISKNGAKVKWMFTSLDTEITEIKVIPKNTEKISEKIIY